MKKNLTKSMSVFLALLMVFSMFVFTPEMFTKAEAHDSGTYYWRVRVNSSNDTGGWDYGNWTVYGKPNNGTGTETTIGTFSQNINFKENGKIVGSGSGANFPTKVSFSYSFGGGVSHRKMDAYIYLDVSSNGSSWTEIASVQSYSYEWGTNKGTKTATVATGNYPACKSVTWEGQKEIAINVPSRTDVSNTATTTSEPKVFDQYGVLVASSVVNSKSALSYIITSSATGTTALGNGFSVSRITTTGSDFNKAKITLSNASSTAANWVLAGGGTQRTAYIRAKVGSNYSDAYEIIASNYTVKVNYNLNGGSYWGTQDEQSASASEDVDYGFSPKEIPTAAYRLGYTFNGIFTANSGGSKVTTSTKITATGETPSVTYYAQWTAIDNPVEFYNSDGQLIQRYTPKYGTTISAVGSPATPSYPGKTQAINGTYTFDKWIVWDAPHHTDWVGTAIGDHTSATLDAASSTTVLKFIATYKLSDGTTAKTYTANFLNAGGSSIGSTTGAYWTAVTPYSAADKPALQQGYTGSVVTAANGFDLTNYDYTFEGWTTTAPSNGKWGTEEDVKYTSADTFRIKENITFYPCYSKTVKQCTVTKKYFAFNAAGVPVVSSEIVPKSEETALGSKFDLGTPEPFSFNYSGYTYTFKGWKKTTSTIPYGTDTADINYASGKAEATITGDSTYFAIYEKTEIKYNAYYYNGSELVKSYENLSRYSTGTNLITYKTADQFDGETPVKERNGQTGYTFVGWVDNQAKVLNPANSDIVKTYTFGEQSKSFYAAYKSFNYYTVTFKSDDGSVLQTSDDYVAGDVIAYTAETPAENAEMFIPVVKNKASGVQYQYTFIGWVSNVEDDNVLSFEDDTAGTVKYAMAPGEGNDITVSANRVYTAVFKKEIREYTISLFDIDVNPELKVNADGYACYTNEGAEYFVKGGEIFTKSADEYVAYEGALKVEDLEAVKADTLATLTLKYGDNILEAVKALYNGGAAVDSNKEVYEIAGTQLQVIPYGQTDKQNIPCETDQYKYSFNGWSPAINPNATVIGDASYVATYRTDNVLYNVHWYTPTAFGGADDFAPTAYSEQTTNYRYKRAIAIPAKTPKTEAPVSKANYTWTFLGWYECDENKVIKTDAEGNEIKYSKGTLADPGDNHNRDFYYVAKFGFVANTYTINVYSADGTVLLGTYKGAYGQPVNITNYKQNPDENYHYELAGFADKTDVNSAIIVADLDSDTTAYIVTGNVDLKVKFTATAHDWANAEIVHNTLPTYKDNGSDTYICECGYKMIKSVDKLVDTNGPVGKIAIKSYNWDKDGGTDQAYIRNDSLIAIMAMDCGENDAEGNAKQDEGNGIKSIVYTWSNGAPGETIEFEEYEKSSANVDVQIPTGDDFTDGMTLTAVITDWTNKTYTITTGALYVDSEKPVIEAETTCEGYTISVIEDHFDSIAVTIDGVVADISAYAVDGSAEGYAAAFVAEKTETELVAEGKYVVTVTDKAGNTAKVSFVVTNAHEWNDGKVTSKATCTEAGVKTFTCTVCGDKRTEVIDALGHDWDAVYEGEGDEKTLVEYVYTTDVKATCTEDGLKSVHCNVCDERIEATVIPAAGHDYVENIKDATCAAAGYKVVTCNNCDLYEYTAYEQLEHVVDMTAEGADENGWVVDKEATCTAEGYVTQVCALCGEKINKTETEIIPHNFKDVTPEGDYCVEEVVEGATPDTYHLYKCEDCGYSYVFNTEAKEHKIVKTLKSEPTCTQDRIYELTCEKGDMEAKEEKERLTSLGGHTWNKDFTVDKEATCTEDGAKSIYCSVCGEMKEDSTVAIPAAHKYEAVTVEATCHTEGKIVYTCSACGDTYEEITGPALDSLHDWDEGVETKAATCTEEGVMTYTCADCGEKETEVIAKLAHVAGDEIAEHTDATCKAVEKTVYKCKNCDEGTITVYGSDYADHVKGALVKTITKATCTVDGEGYFNCSVCGQTMTAVIPATGEHSYTSKVTTKATCTVAGVKTFTCSACGDAYTEEIKATGHEFEAYTENATCTTAGSTYNKCTVCGEIEEGSATEIPAPGHTWVTDAAVESTCSKTGLTEGEHCSACGEVKTAQTVTEKKAHTQGALITTKVDATCVKDGLGVYKCTVCNDSFEKVIPADASNHNFSVWGAWTEVTAATCNDKGLEKAVRTCLNEDCTESEEKTRETSALGHDFVLDYVGDPVTVDGITTITTYYKCSRCDATTSEDDTTTLYIVTVDGKTINLVDGESLTEEKIVEALGALPTKEAAESEDGVYEVVWMVDGAEVTLPADVEKDSVLTYDFKFIANTYEVIFYNASGKIISQKSYTKGQTVEVPDDLYVSGNRFLGWTDGENNFAADEIPAVTETVSYTPWLLSNDNFATYYVTFKNDTGSKTLYTATVECLKGETVSFSLPADLAKPTKDSNTVYHYVFDGWLDKDGNKVAFPVDITSSVTFKASFKAVKHEDSVASKNVIPANCTNAEKTAYKCTCGYEWSVFTAPANGHDYIEISRETEGGITTINYFCTVCEDTYSRTVTGGTTDVIVVRVTDGSSPVSGAKVTVYLNASKALEATTDANGNAYFNKDLLTDGTYQVKVTKDNFDTKTGQLNVKNATASLKVALTKQPCHCGCHASGFFGNIKRFFTKFIRLFSKNYNCCSCGEVGKIY